MVHIQQCHLMPREQQICERLAPSLIYLFPRLCGFGESRILLSISCSYLTDFKWKHPHFLSSPHTTHFHLYTSLWHFIPFPCETRLDPLKSIPTLFPIGKSVHILITQKTAPDTTLSHSHSSHSHSIPSKTTPTKRRITQTRKKPKPSKTR